MLRCSIIVGLGCLLWQPCLHGQDTVQVKTVRVTATAAQPDAVGAAVTVLDSTTLQRLRPMQVSDVMTMIPGLFVKDYGGLGGMKSVSLRGGSASQTLIMVDDLVWNSTQSGMIDLSTIPTAFLRSVTVERGPLSAIYGAHAMTGAVRLSLGVPNQPAHVMLEGGSFETWRISAASSLHTSGAHVGVGVDVYGTDGSFSYPVRIAEDDADVDLLRENADVRSWSGLARVEVTSGIAAGWNITALGRQGRRGVPGAVVSGRATTQPRARMDDTEGAVIAQSPQLQIGPVVATAVVGGRYLDQHYADPDASFAGPGGIDARFLLRDGTATVQARYDHTMWTHHLRVEAGATDLRGTSLQPSVGGRVERRRVAVSYTAHVTPEDALSVQGTIRGDVYSDAGTAMTATVGSTWRVAETLSLRSSIGTAFRPPSFNELYFLNYGTANLQPERSATVSAGATGSLWHVLRWEADVYATHYSTLIVAVPLSPVVTSAQNVAGAEARGIELSVTAQPWTPLQVRWAYTLQSMLDRTGRTGLDGTAIPYVPSELISAGAAISWQDLHGGADWTYTSFRYAQGGAEPTSLLQPFHVLSLYVGHRIHGASLHGTVQLRLDNALDAQYQVVRGFPMPGRVIRLSLEVGV
jgi:vitamin B12 transporter